MALHFQLVTLSGIEFDQEVYEVILPTASGDIAVFAQHQPLVSVVVPGAVTVVHAAGDNPDKQDHYATEGGIAEITSSGLRVLVDAVTHGRDIVEEEAKHALERAHTLKQEAPDELSLEHAQALVDRESARLKVAEIRRRRKIK